MKHAPTKFLDIEIIKPRIYQDTAELNSLVAHSAENNITGNMLWCHMEKSQLGVGGSTKFYELPNGKILGCKMNWGFTIIWEFISSEAIILRWKHMKNLLKLRVGNIYIMEATI